MGEHYTRNTTGIMKHCATCGRMAMHKVSGKRVGSCTEVHTEGLSERQKKLERDRLKSDDEPTLF